MKSRAPGVLNNDSKTQKRSIFYLMNFFTEHPESVGETYFEHFFVAIRFSCKLFLSSIAALIHAFIPALFKKTASTQIKKMYGQMTSRK